VIEGEDSAFFVPFSASSHCQDNKHLSQREASQPESISARHFDKKIAQEAEQNALFAPTISFMV